MAYRAPELFDVKTGVTLDEKVDIWVGTLLRPLDQFINGHLSCSRWVAPYTPWHTHTHLLKIPKPLNKEDLLRWLS